MNVKKLVVLGGIIAGMLIGCVPNETAVVSKGHPMLIELREEAKNGRIPGIRLPLGATYQEIIAAYGQPKKILNDECWTFSYDHTSIDATFFYDHDSCNEELNQVKPETKVNKITVSPQFLHTEITENDVKRVYGQPTEEYVNEAYGGYYVQYQLDKYRLIFKADEETKEIKTISVVSF